MPSATSSASLFRLNLAYTTYRHLGGYCENGKFCNFQHEPKLTPAELNALRYKTRSLACKNKGCENIDCCKCIRRRGIRNPCYVTTAITVVLL
jgi:hypothetical protein